MVPVFILVMVSMSTFVSRQSVVCIWPSKGRSSGVSSRLLATSADKVSRGSPIQKFICTCGSHASNCNYAVWINVHLLTDMGTLVSVSVSTSPFFWRISIVHWWRGLCWKSHITCSFPTNISQCILCCEGLSRSLCCMWWPAAVASSLVMCCVLQKKTGQFHTLDFSTAPPLGSLNGLMIFDGTAIQDDSSNRFQSSSNGLQLSSQHNDCFSNFEYLHHFEPDCGRIAACIAFSVGVVFLGVELTKLGIISVILCILLLGREFNNFSWAASSQHRKFCTSICDTSSSSLW